jgi:hypothetical protein
LKDGQKDIAKRSINWQVGETKPNKENKMIYKITIEKTEDVVKKCGKDWKVVDQVQKKSDFDDGVYLSDVHGYTPEIEKTVEITEKVFEQTVSYLDLRSVILAINEPEKCETPYEVARRIRD